MDPAKIRYSMNLLVKGHYTSDIGGMSDDGVLPGQPKKRVRLASKVNNEFKLNLLKVELRTFMKKVFQLIIKGQ